MPIRPRSPERIDRHRRERRRQQGAVLDHADRAALLGDEDPAVGRLRERGRARQAGDPGLVAGEAARLGHAAAELHQRRRPGRDVARGVARARPQHVLAAGVEAGVDGGGIRRGGVGGADGHAVDLELDAGHGDVVAGGRGDATMPVRPVGEVGRRVSVAVGAMVSAPTGGLTVTLTAALVVAAPRESVARAVRLCAPARGRRPAQRIGAGGVFAEQGRAVEEFDLGDGRRCRPRSRSGSWRRRWSRVAARRGSRSAAGWRCRCRRRRRTHRAAGGPARRAPCDEFRSV